MHALPVGSSSSSSRASALAHVRDRLERVAEAVRQRGIQVPQPEGQLLRPLVAYALVPPERRGELDDRFWCGALAVQMVHEASLLHDDILDHAAERRGAPSVAAASGVGPALVMGDHYLTGAYRVALGTGSEPFLRRFIEAVERTVAGEIRQATSTGKMLDLGSYFDVALGKSGELLGASASLGGAVLGLGRLDERAALGRQVGALYQQIDDLLDYCTHADTGKAPLQDYHQRKWTWMLEVAEVGSFDLSDEQVATALFSRGPQGASAAERAVRALEVRRDGLLRALGKLDADEELLGDILEDWIAEARQAVAREVRAHARAPRARRPHTGSESAEGAVAAEARRLGAPTEWARYFASHARTFSLAARLFPRGPRERVTALYAYCRFTDDLVDAPAAALDPYATRRRLEAWAALSRESFSGSPTGIDLIDVVMSHARASEVAWRYPSALLRGAALDLEPVTYISWEELRDYTFCVAGAVGGWMSQLLGVREPDLLEQAHALGHGMQLTNILRDVGEDLGRGRIYLPTALLERHGISVAELLLSATWDVPPPDGWSAAMEELIARAEQEYEQAREGIRRLPAFFRRPVAAAAEAYRGIHGEVRANAYDNLGRRAYTSLPTKVRLGLLGLLRASHSRRGYTALVEGLAS